MARGCSSQQSGHSRCVTARVSRIISQRAYSFLSVVYREVNPQLPPSTDVLPVTVRSETSCNGVTVMAMAYRTRKNPGYGRPLIKEYLGGTPYYVPERHRIPSPPLSHIAAKTPPTITLIGACGPLVPREHAGPVCRTGFTSSRKRPRLRHRLGRFRHPDRAGNHQGFPPAVRSPLAGRFSSNHAPIQPWKRTLFIAEEAPPLQTVAGRALHMQHPRAHP